MVTRTIKVIVPQEMPEYQWRLVQAAVSRAVETGRLGAVIHDEVAMMLPEHLAARMNVEVL